MINELARAPLRRRPRQGRSAQRIELILDTTASLIDEVGFSNLSPTLIAKRVGMSGPGIYRYFDGLEAIASALATRNLTRFMDGAREALEDRTESWEVLLGRVIGVYCALYRNEPGFRWLRLGDSIDRNLIDTTVSNRSVVARVVADLFIARFEVLPRENLFKHVEVVVEIADTLTARAFETDARGDQFFIDECVQVCTEYITDFLERVQPSRAASAIAG